MLEDSGNSYVIVLTIQEENFLDCLLKDLSYGCAIILFMIFFNLEEISYRSADKCMTFRYFSFCIKNDVSTRVMIIFQLSNNMKYTSRLSH
jgi:hypothetical protein